MGWIFGIILLILVLVAISDFHVFTSYTCSIEKAYEEYNKWKKNYEKCINREIELVDAEQYGTHVDFYYRVKRKKK